VNPGRRGTDFAASPLDCSFMSNELCGNPKKPPAGAFGFSAWPDSTRVRARPTYIQVGLNGDAHNRTGFEPRTREKTTGL
jgi:hypothetical protein